MNSSTDSNNNQNTILDSFDFIQQSHSYRNLNLVCSASNKDKEISLIQTRTLYSNKILKRLNNCSNEEIRVLLKIILSNLRQY